jgi:hypothetical protein
MPQFIRVYRGLVGFSGSTNLVSHWRALGSERELLPHFLTDSSSNSKAYLFGLLMRSESLDIPARFRPL